MKTKIQIIGCLFLIAFAGAGCIGGAVPKTEITGSLAGKPFTFSAPKDVNLGSLTLSADTNGTISLTLTNLQTRMNPDVITTTGEAQAKLITAVGQQVIQGMMSAKP